jgi:TonB-dependent SusC/RagA subfamily outer membrane receptor
MELRPVTQATNALEGAAPGIQVNNSYGEPGSDKTSIRIRGFGSINGSNEPLIVVDGSPYSGNLNDINPQDIESMSVLKDASSAALYGNKAANGVVLITTKKGKSNKLNLRMNVKQGMYTRAIPQYDKLGAKDWMEAMLQGWSSFYQKDAGLAPADALVAAASTLNSSVVRTKIFDKNGADMFDANGKLVANILPGYSDLDWTDALAALGAFSLLVSSCSFFSNMQVPESVSVKTDAKYSVPLGTASYDISSVFGKDTLKTGHNRKQKQCFPMNSA